MNLFERENLLPISILTMSNSKASDSKLPKKWWASVEVYPSMKCKHFVKRWEEFETELHTKDHVVLSESDAFGLLSSEKKEAWRAVIQDGMDAHSRDEGSEYFKISPDEQPRVFAAKHINAIADLGYPLNSEHKDVLQTAFHWFYVCDVGPAPFSLAAIFEQQTSDSDVAVSVANHCLQMATHWLRHPPACMTVLELDEFIVLSLFHDVFYYEDFANHDTRILDLFGRFLRFKQPRKIVAGHLDLKPDAAKLKSRNFDSEFDALKQEWVQMDW